MATVDSTAIYPSERERTVKGALEYRVFYGLGQTRHPDLPWIFIIREVGADGVEAHIHHGAYRTDYEAKRAVVQWDGPAPAPE